jgi:hypothetical protein
MLKMTALCQHSHPDYSRNPLGQYVTILRFSALPGPQPGHRYPANDSCLLTGREPDMRSARVIGMEQSLIKRERSPACHSHWVAGAEAGPAAANSHDVRRRCRQSLLSSTEPVVVASGGETGRQRNRCHVARRTSSRCAPPPA